MNTNTITTEEAISNAAESIVYLVRNWNMTALQALAHYFQFVPGWEEKKAVTDLTLAMLTA